MIQQQNRASNRMSMNQSDKQQYDHDFEQEDNPDALKSSVLKNPKKDSVSKLPLVSGHSKLRKSTDLSVSKPQCGKYERKVNERIQRYKITAKTSIESLNTFNLQIKCLLREYNEDLKAIINRNFKNIITSNQKGEENMKESKVHTISNWVEVLKNQKVNNTKVEEGQTKELKKLKKKQKLLDQALSMENNDSDWTDLAEKKAEKAKQLASNIHSLKKQICAIKYCIENDGKKLLPLQEQIHPQTKGEQQERYSILKHRIHEDKVNFTKNQERLELLERKLTELKGKIESQNFKQKSRKAEQTLVEAKVQSKNRGELEAINKKFVTLKNHKNKTEALYTTKQNVAKYDNNQIREEIKVLGEAIIQRQSINQELVCQINQVLQQFKLIQLNPRIIDQLIRIGFSEDDLTSETMNDKNFQQPFIRKEQALEQSGPQTKDEKKECRVWENQTSIERHSADKKNIMMNNENEGKQDENNRGGRQAIKTEAKVSLGNLQSQRNGDRSLEPIDQNINTDIER